MRTWQPLIPSPKRRLGKEFLHFSNIKTWHLRLNKLQRALKREVLRWHRSWAITNFRQLLLKPLKLVMTLDIKDPHLKRESKALQTTEATMIFKSHHLKTNYLQRLSSNLMINPLLSRKFKTLLNHRTWFKSLWLWKSLSLLLICSNWHL